MDKFSQNLGSHGQLVSFVQKAIQQGVGRLVENMVADFNATKGRGVRKAGCRLWSSAGFFHWSMQFFCIFSCFPQVCATVALTHQKF